MKTIALLSLFCLLSSVKIEAAAFDKAVKSSPSSVTQLHGTDYNLSPDRCIISFMFNENTLRHTETDFLVRLCEAEIRKPGSVLPGRNREIKNALIRKIEGLSDAEVAEALLYAFSNDFFSVLNVLLRSVSNRLPGIIDSLNCSENLKCEEFLEVLQMVRTRLNGDCAVGSSESSDGSSDDGFELINQSDMVVEIYETVKSILSENLPANRLLPAVLRIYLNNPDLQDSQVKSKFLKHNILNGTCDIRVALALYEVEMRDYLHTHDRRGIIERRLKESINKAPKDSMVLLALEMYENQFWNALKLIIDVKFSGKPWLKNPILFFDIAHLFKRAEELGYQVPEGFYGKVLELASPEAARRYIKSMDAAIEPEFIETIPDYVEEDDAEGDESGLDTIEF